MLLAVPYGDQHVGGLDVSVHETFGMGGVQRGSELLQEIDSPIWLKRARFPKQVSQVTPRYEVHDQEEQPFVLPA